MQDSWPLKTFLILGYLEPIYPDFRQLIWKFDQNSSQKWPYLIFDPKTVITMEFWQLLGCWVNPRGGVYFSSRGGADFSHQRGVLISATRGGCWFQPPEGGAPPPPPLVHLWFRVKTCKLSVECNSLKKTQLLRWLVNKMSSIEWSRHFLKELIYWASWVESR